MKRVTRMCCRRHSAAATALFAATAGFLLMQLPAQAGKLIVPYNNYLLTNPMLRLDPEFMVSAISVYAGIGDKRAAILADQMLEAEMHAGQRRHLILAQVRIKLNEDDLEAAGKVYRKLKALAPQSDELIGARELIKAAVIKGKS